MLATVTASTLTLRWAAPHALPWRPGALYGLDPVAAVTAGCALAAWLVSGWLALGAACTVAGLLPGAAGRVASAAATVVAPWTMRRLVGAAVGVTLVTHSVAAGAVALAAGPSPAPTAATAVAVPTRVPGPSTSGCLGGGPAPLAGSCRDRPARAPGYRAEPPLAGASVAVPVTGAAFGGPAPPLLDRPDIALVAPASRRPVPRRSGPAEVVVRRGDSLWAIAARHLGTSATDTDVAAAWPHWYAANRAVIGPDPDLLLPGQRLTAPDR